MKLRFATLLFLLTTYLVGAQDALNISDFEILNQTNWEGQLTYKDYQSGKMTSIDATMQIAISGDKITSKIQYTYEPNKNNTSSVKIKKNGTYYGNEKIIDNTMTAGTRTFVTTYDGRDNKKKATMYITHQFSESIYKVMKEVQYHDSNERFVRNTYEFNRIRNKKQI